MGEIGMTYSETRESNSFLSRVSCGGCSRDGNLFYRQEFVVGWFFL